MSTGYWIWLILMMIIPNIGMYFMDILDFFKGKRKDKIKIKELELKIINAKSKNNNQHNSKEICSNSSSPENNKKISKYQWIKIAISCASLLAAIILAVLKFNH